MKKNLSMAVLSILTASTLFAADAKKEVVLASDVEWTHLNPKRGDLAPSAGTLWGDRNGKLATGYLLKPNDGFQSPPHIHNVSYRAIVISGLIHNDDPAAEKMWMPTGSFWTQPKGEVHITASQGKNSLAYIEIEEGPYLVMPTEMAFDSGERAVNVDAKNIVWLDAKDTNWINKPQSGVKVSFLWGETANGKLNGSFIKLPAGFKGQIKSEGSTFKSVVIQGTPQYNVDGKIKTLETGSYFAADGGISTHEISSQETSETVLYIRTNGKYDIITNKK